MKVMTLVERGGEARSIHVDRLTSAKVYEILVLNAKRESTLNRTRRVTTCVPGAVSPNTRP